VEGIGELLEQSAPDKTMARNLEKPRKRFMIEFLDESRGEHE
jgi:hypothetical protein